MNLFMVSTTLKNIIDILLVWLVIYFLFKLVKNNVKTKQIVKGILLILLLKAITEQLNLVALGWLVNNVINWGFLGIIIIFQPEIRSFLEQLGRSQIMQFKTMTVTDKEKLLNELYVTVEELSRKRIGGLITIEKGQSLAEFISNATPIHAQLSHQLLTSIFMPSTPLHDGAVIIQGNDVACASAYFPPTERKMDGVGARHRAAVGISEVTDSVTIVVSEQTGDISIALKGIIGKVPLESFKDELGWAIDYTQETSTATIDDLNVGGV